MKAIILTASRCSDTQNSAIQAILLFPIVLPFIQINNKRLYKKENGNYKDSTMKEE